MAERKIALVGSAPSSLRIAPYGDPSWEIWGVSPGVYGVAPRVTAWFELHLWEPGVPWFSPEYCQWLRALPSRGVVLWTGAAIPDLPGSKVLPHREILAEFDPNAWFCTSSLFWMIAMAIKAGATKIGMWGIDMAATTEYEAQRSGIHFMAYICQQRGIEIGVPPESDVFTPRFKYGIDEWTHSFRKTRAREAELQQRLAAAQAQTHASQGEVAFLTGALDNSKYMADTWADKSTHTAPVDPAGSIWAPKPIEPKALTVGTQDGQYVVLPYAGPAARPLTLQEWDWGLSQPQWPTEMLGPKRQLGEAWNPSAEVQQSPEAPTNGKS